MSLLDFYQHLPEKIDPIAISIGSFSLAWYSLMYLVGLVVVYLLLLYRIKKGEAAKLEKHPSQKIKLESLVQDLLIYLFLGLLFGARIGYVLFYNPDFYLKNPLAIISPLDINGNLVGIYGLSYHGGLLGAVAAGYIFCKKYKMDFWKLADFIMPAIPAAYFFGRIGNFLNGELYGRPTEKFWGMYFSEDYAGLLRHPSQLYEAFFEGALLFIILWLLRNNKKLAAHNLFLPAYIFGYSFVRFFIEFFRQPDAQVGLFFGWLSLGQIFSLVLVFFSIIFSYFRGRQKVV